MNWIDLGIYLLSVVLVSGWAAIHAYRFGYAKGRRDEILNLPIKGEK